MSRVIRISEELYKRLEAYASGFDTPSNVIEKILNAYENVPSSSASTPDNLDDLASDEGMGASEKDTNIQPAAGLEIIPGSKPIIVFVSGLKIATKEKFKQDLLAKKIAFRKLFYTNGKAKVDEWNASKFKPESNLLGNIWTGPLKEWESKGIAKLIVSVNRADLDHFTD